MSETLCPQCRASSPEHASCCRACGRLLTYANHQMPFSTHLLERSKIGSARVRLVALEQVQQLHTGEDRVEAIEIVETLPSASNRAKKVITMVVTWLGFFMVLLDTSIIMVALPTIQTSLGTQLSDLQWVVDAYTLPLAALMLTTGILGDRFGQKRVFLTGLVLFLLGSMACGRASTLGWFFFGRAVQGMGAAALSTSSLALLAAAFSDPRERAQVVGIWTGIASLGIAAGPLVGGLLIQISGWPAIFFVNLPIGLVALGLGWPLLTESCDPGARKLDLRGQLLAIGALACLVTALIESSSQGWTSAWMLTLFISSGVCLFLFLLVEARVPEPLLPLGLFRSRVFSLANLAGLIAGFALIGTVFFLTQYFQEVLGYTALGSGLHGLPITIGMFLASPLAGRLAVRPGPRLPIVLGTLLVGCGFFLLLRLTPTDNYAALWWNLIILGLGLGFILGPAGLAVLSATPPNREGLGSSIFDTSRQLGTSLGVAVLGAFVTQQFSENITSQLVQQGIPKSIGATIANQIANAGSQAGQALSRGHFPFPPAVLRQAIGQAFVDAIKQSFFISSIVLLVIAVLVALLFQEKRRVKHTSHEQFKWPKPTSPNLVALSPEDSVSQMDRSAALPQRRELATHTSHKQFRWPKPTSPNLVALSPEGSASQMDRSAALPQRRELATHTSHKQFKWPKPTSPNLVALSPEDSASQMDRSAAPPQRREFVDPRQEKGVLNERERKTNIPSNGASDRHAPKSLRILR